MKQYSKISGVAYLIIFLAGFFANFAVLENLADYENTTTIGANIVNNNLLFGFGIIGFIVMLISDFLLVWSLYKLTETTNKSLSYAASVFRLLHVTFFGIALEKLFTIYNITSYKKLSPSLTDDILELLHKFDTIWTIGLLFFAAHLFILGYIAIKSVIIPRAIGYLLIVAGLGYTIDGTAKLILNSYAEHQALFEMIVLLTAVIGELSFMIWLLYYGFKKQPQ